MRVFTCCAAADRCLWSGDTPTLALCAPSSLQRLPVRRAACFTFSCDFGYFFFFFLSSR